MFSEGTSQKPRASMDISPLLDVAFLLLIFFAVTTTFLEDSGLDLELPESTTASPTEQAPAVVTVSADGGITFRGESLSVQELESIVRDLSAEELRRITLRADSRVDFGAVVAVFDALRRAGARGLSLPMRAAQGPTGEEPGGPQRPQP